MTRTTSPRSGFSLIEALVVLAIGGMALAVVFSIGLRASDSGFSLGRRAMDAADTDIKLEEVRTLFRSFVVRPLATMQSTSGAAIEGGATSLRGETVLEWATRCGPVGWAGLLTLSIEPREEGGQVLACATSGRKVPILEIPEGGATFAYSMDGLEWSSNFSNSHQPGTPVLEIRELRIFIRLSSRDRNLIETAGSGDVQLWNISDAP